MMLENLFFLWGGGGEEGCDFPFIVLLCVFFKIILNCIEWVTRAIFDELTNEASHQAWFESFYDGLGLPWHSTGMDHFPYELSNFKKKAFFIVIPV